MFYSTQILSRKGPLGIIWIAAHLDRRLKRHQIFETSIPVSVDSIINPEAPLALRLSGQLLLGVVRIYSRKVGYLYQDCNDALVRLQQAFKESGVDLPIGGVTAPLHAITLPDSYDDMEFLTGDDMFPLQPFGQLDTLPTLNVNMRNSLSLTLVEDLSEAFGSQHPIEDEQFEIAGDELERRISMSDGIERLRAEPADMADHFLGLPVGRPPSPGLEVFGKDEELLPAVDELSGLGGEAGMPASAPPSSVRQLLMDTPAGSNLTPGTNLDEMLPNVGELPTPAMLDLDMMDAAEHNERAASPQPLPEDLIMEAAADAEQEEHRIVSPEATQQQPPHQETTLLPEQHDDDAAAGEEGTQALQLKLSRKRKVKIDVVDGRPATELPGHQIRALLKDRSPLLCQRGQPAKRHRATHGAEDSTNLLYKPAVTHSIAPELLSLYNMAMALAEKPQKEVRHAKKGSKSADVEDAQPVELAVECTPSAPEPAGPASEGAAGVDIAVCVNSSQDNRQDEPPPDTQAGGAEDEALGGPPPDAELKAHGEEVVAEVALVDTDLQAAVEGEVAAEGRLVDIDMQAANEFEVGGDWQLDQHAAMETVHDGPEHGAEGLEPVGPVEEEQQIMEAQEEDGLHFKAVEAEDVEQQNMQMPLGDGNGFDIFEDEEHEGDSEHEQNDEDTQQGFTARTKKVALCLEKHLLPKQNGKAKQGKSLNSQVSLDSLLGKKSRGESARWFFEMLVLKTKNYISLEQNEPYGEIIIYGEPKLAARS